MLSKKPSVVAHKASVRFFVFIRKYPVHGVLIVLNDGGTSGGAERANRSGAFKIPRAALEPEIFGRECADGAYIYGVKAVGII